MVSGNLPPRMNFPPLNSLDAYSEFIKTINLQGTIILGGMAIFQAEEEPNKRDAYTCSNISCGRIFEKPIKVLNLQKVSAEPYYACPHCLCEMVARNPPIATCERSEENKTEEKLSEEKRVEIPETPSGCPFHIGYLSERSSKEPLSEDCIVCKDIVQCMLKNIRG
jgi:hypothetical protein